MSCPSAVLRGGHALTREPADANCAGRFGRRDDPPNGEDTVPTGVSSRGGYRDYGSPAAGYDRDIHCEDELLKRSSTFTTTWCSTGLSGFVPTTYGRRHADMRLIAPGGRNRSDHVMAREFVYIATRCGTQLLTEDYCHIGNVLLRFD